MEYLMTIIIASSNQGKIKEIKEFFQKDVIPYSQLLGEFEIIEDANSFKGNSILKAKAINDKLTKEQKQNYIILADDSGITVPALGNEPDIYSARYAGVNATSKENLAKLIQKLKDNNLQSAQAYYTCAITIIKNDKIHTTHGWMHGDVIPRALGDGGFGYDPMFVPSGLDRTLGELNSDIKYQLSHRTKALKLAFYFI